MECRQVQDKLAEYQVGLLDANERATIEAHLASCEACRTELAALARVGELITLVPEAAPERDLWPEVAARLQPRRKKAPSWLALRWRPVAAAATLAAATAILLIAFLPGPTTVPPVPGGEEFLLADAEVIAQWEQPMADEASLGLYLLLQDNGSGDAEL